MDFHLKQWRNQRYESEEDEQNHSAKIPKLLNTMHQNNSNNNNNETQFKKPEYSSGTVLPLFVQSHRQQLQMNTTNKITTNLSPPPRMGSNYFSLAQWQELELQALIFSYMVAGATVPVELLSPIKRSLTTLLNTPTYFLHHQNPLHQYYQSPAALFQSGCWRRAAVDPEPGRCRRTDGKKWRCSRDVVVGQKYCERHMHRGRHRSRKPVETPTPASSDHGGGGETHSAATGKISGGGGDTNATSVGILRLGRSSSERSGENGPGETKFVGHVLRHFFDDWPRSRQEQANVATGSRLSISMPGIRPQTFD